ncbi:MAG: hypothetical protein R6U93_04960 [Dehalococcoidia bacterium]
MSTGSWLKSHRKHIITHTAIIVGFVLLVIFVAEPLFDGLERISGEAQLHQLHLPAETGGMRSYIDELRTDGCTTVEVMGWAFIEGENSENNEVYVVLESSSGAYVFDTMRHARPDVTTHFEELGLNLDHSGFMALIPARKIPDGEYTVGIYVTKGDVEALHYTDRAITKSEGTVKTA